MRTAWSCCLAVFGLWFLSVSGCGSTSGAHGRSETAEGGGQPPCPAPSTGFPLRERLRGVVGCPSDIETRPGTSPGYEVAFKCLDRGDRDAVVVVRGLGKKPFRQLLGRAPTEDDDGEREVWCHFADNVRKTAVVQSIHRSVRIHACRSSGYAIELGMHNFREVDDAVRTLGDWLARMNSNGEVMIVIEPEPDPVESP
jgi:hypothetical protein